MANVQKPSPEDKEKKTSKKEPKPKVVRKPIERCYAQSKEMSQTVERFARLVTAWLRADRSAPDALGEILDVLVTLRAGSIDLMTTFRKLHSAGFDPPETKVPLGARNGMSAGTLVTMKLGPNLDRWLKLVDDPADLDHLIVVKIVESQAIVDIDAYDEFPRRRLGPVFRGNLVIKAAK